MSGILELANHNPPYLVLPLPEGLLYVNDIYSWDSNEIDSFERNVSFILWFTWFTIYDNSLIADLEKSSWLILDYLEISFNFFVTVQSLCKVYIVQKCNFESLTYNTILKICYIWIMRLKKVFNQLIPLTFLFSGDPLYVGFDLTIASFDSISEVSMVSQKYFLHLQQISLKSKQS